MMTHSKLPPVDDSTPMREINMRPNIYKNGAEFTPDRKYRFALWRIWNYYTPKIMFIGLNPSTADETKDDPTIKRVSAIAKNLGYGGVYMLNCFPFVTAYPNELIDIPENLQKTNDFTLTMFSGWSKDVVFAWGNFSIVRELKADLKLFNLFPNAKTLHINKNGSPKHPLYCRTDSILIPFR